MAELNIPRAHSYEWYDNLAQVQPGYYYPWSSHIGTGDGESAFLALVKGYLTPDTRVLEVGCGHGDLALSLAPHCQSIVAYDRVESYIELAQAAKSEQGIDNVEFLVHDALSADGDAVNLPVDNAAVDLIISRRAPLHWILDARRVCVEGGRLIALCPMEEPIPAWSSKLPPKMHYENSGRHTGQGSIHDSVDNRLHQAGLSLHSGWGFNVPEVFANPEELYTMVTWGLPADEVPAYDDIAYKFDTIFERYAGPRGIVMRHCRYLWMAKNEA